MITISVVIMIEFVDSLHEAPASFLPHVCHRNSRRKLAVVRVKDVEVCCGLSQEVI